MHHSAALHVKEAGSDQNIHLENSVGDKWFLTTWANMDRFSIGRAGILDDFLINDRRLCRNWRSNEPLVSIADG